MNKTQNDRYNSTLLLLSLFLMLLVIPQPVYAQTESPEIVVIEATGPVIAPFASFISRGIEEADERNAEAVILVLDTPGGQVNQTLEIVQDIRNSDVPVIVYVGPPGAKAASAGLLITLAGHAAAMAPDTAIGASSPIDMSGGDLQGTAEEKAEQYLSAQARGLAEKRGEAAIELANEAVTAARAASFQEAYDANLVDFIADDLDDLLAQLHNFEIEILGDNRTLNTRNASTIFITPSPLEQILFVVTDPNILSLLLLIGPILLIVEIRTPGGWVAGALGTVFMGLALYGLGVLPVNWLGLVFVGLAIVLFILEVTTPTNGILAAVATASMAVGIIVLFSQPGIEQFGTLSIPLVIGQSIVVGALFAFFAIMVMRAHRLQPTTGREGMIGQTARVVRDLDPEGMILIMGERWNAFTTDKHTIPAGQDVEIVEFKGMRIKVTTEKADE